MSNLLFKFSNISSGRDSVSQSKTTALIGVSFESSDSWYKWMLELILCWRSGMAEAIISVLISQERDFSDRGPSRRSVVYNTSCIDRSSSSLSSAWVLYASAVRNAAKVMVTTPVPAPEKYRAFKPLHPEVACGW